MKQMLSILLGVAFTLAAFAADPEAAVNELLPQLANPDVPKRYDAQIALQALASNASKPGNDNARAALGKILAGKAADTSVPQPARVWIVRQLEYMGREEAVEALTRLLHGDDAELRECARRALEKNPAPAAGNSLWAALEKVATDQDEAAIRWKIGLMNCLAERGDTSAVGLIVPRLQDDATAAAAALALGKIANDSSITALWTVFPANRFAGEALINAANARLARGDQAGAKAVFEKLNSTEHPQPLRAAALAGLIKADPNAAPERIAEGLTANPPRVQQATLTAAQAALGNKASSVLARLLPELAPVARIQVLEALDASAESAVIHVAADADDEVRVAALTTLGRIGGAASVPVLLTTAASETKAQQSAATAALATIAGAGAGEAIAKAATSGETAARIAAIRATATRNDRSALPGLLKSAGESDATLRSAAFDALGKLGADTEMEPVARLALSLDGNAAAALEAMAARVNDQPAAARKLLALAGNDPKAQATLLKALVVLGGQDVLATASKLTTSPDAKTQEAAVRALMNSTDYAACKPLLAVAANPATDTTQYVLALAAVARLVMTGEDQPAAERAQTILAALSATRRDPDKKMILSALGTVPHPDVAATLKDWLAKPEFKAEAAQAAMKLAESWIKTDAAAGKELAQAIKDADLSPDLTKRANRVLKN